MFLPKAKTSWWMYLLVPAYLALWLGLSQLIPESVYHYYPHFILSYTGLLIALGALSRIRAFIDQRRALVNFRALSQEEQQAYLRSVWPSGLRSEYLRLVDMDETYILEGKEAQFPFPEAERRLHRRLTAILLAFLALMILSGVVFSDLPRSIRIVPAFLAILCALPAAWLIGRLALLETTLRVTPFSASISGPALRHRQISLNHPLILTNFPARGYFQLEDASSGQRLRIHHARLGALHAYKLICEYAGLSSVDEGDPAAS